MYEKKQLGVLEDALFFESLNSMVEESCRYSPHPISAMANISALIHDQMTDLNWVGFYIFHDDRFIVGPFQGKPARTEIKIGQGVCGHAAELKKVVVVDDVDAFEGHIACDAESKSELVAPIISHTSRLHALIDLDSPSYKRFGPECQKGFEQIASTMSRNLDWNNLSL